VSDSSLLTLEMEKKRVISSLKITLPKILQLKTLDFLQQTITMNENAQWQMIKDSVLFALSSGFFVSLFHFYLKKQSTRGALCLTTWLPTGNKLKDKSRDLNYLQYKQYASGYE
jgi:hypothetical protein